MVQIKVTPEMLEEVANRANNTRIALESIHNNLCNEIDYLCSQWIGASNQQFVQMFNDARPKAFTSINSVIQVEEDLKRIAEKFRNADDQDVILNNDVTVSDPSSGEEFDGGKLARDIAGELTGEYDLRRVWEGVDPSTGDKLSWLDRVGAGGMMVLGVTPVGKLAKLAKGAKMTVKAAGKLTPAERAAKKGFPDIKTSPNGGPDFKDTPYLYPVKEGQKNIVSIEMTGNRQKDFKVANEAAGFAEAGRKSPDKKYTWHHFDDFDPETGTCTMQLAYRKAHEATLPHLGACAQYEQHHGEKTYNKPRKKK
ncbi:MULTISPECIES: WXG100 family type VII secretion target [Bacillus cereus group]|nr:MULTISPECIES: WXG100 family type VII secretion target [Bacillus cereus group]MBJ8061097.1 WXG100 family type VII secretion target [Bacillus cereus]